MMYFAHFLWKHPGYSLQWCVSTTLKVPANGVVTNVERCGLGKPYTITRGMLPLVEENWIEDGECLSQSRLSQLVKRSWLYHYYLLAFHFKGNDSGLLPHNPDTWMVYETLKLNKVRRC